MVMSVCAKYRYFNIRGRTNGHQKRADKTARALTQSIGWRVFSYVARTVWVVGVVVHDQYVR